MLVIHRRIAPQTLWAAELLLNFEARSKSRLRCFSADGEDVGLFLSAASRRCTMANSYRLKTDASYACAHGLNICCTSPAAAHLN